MKINNPGIPGGSGGLPGGDNSIANAAKANRSAALEKLGHSGAYSKASDPSSSGSDEVSISSLAQAMQSLRSDSPERQSRMDAIAQQVASGSYQVDSTILSRSLIQNGFSQNEPGPKASSGNPDGGSL